jgi:nucleolar protein 56
MHKRDRFIKKAKESVSEALKSRDMLLSGITKTLDVYDKILNMACERLEEWHSIYFPELKLEDKRKFVEVVLVLDRKEIDMKELSKLVGQTKAEEIADKARKSLGADLSREDLAECQHYAAALINMYKLRERETEYQQKFAIEICPNLAVVAGPELAAKLVSHMGSLRRLAFMPASTIQVIGAEKALFKHLKNRRVDPPKHGLIFQHPRISASPKRVRGKIARALAAKLSIAAKADAFTKRNISEKLLSDFEKRYEQIMKAYSLGKENRGKEE